MRDYTELQNAGNKAGLEKLKMNEHKDGFDNIDMNYAYGRILEECTELGIEMNKSYWEYGDYEAIRHEAADVRNFCDMIILKCDKEIL